MNSESLNKTSNKPNEVESKSLSFNERKSLVEGYLKIQQTIRNQNINIEKEKNEKKEKKEKKYQ